VYERETVVPDAKYNHIVTGIIKMAKKRLKADLQVSPDSRVSGFLLCSI